MRFLRDGNITCIFGCASVTVDPEIGGRERSQSTLPDFEFIAGPKPHVLRIVYRGFWDEAVLQRYAATLRQRAIDAGGSTGVTRVLLDIREGTIQSQPVIDKFEELLRAYAGQVHHYALLMPAMGSLLALQMRRLMQDFNVRILSTEKQGEA